MIDVSSLDCIFLTYHEPNADKNWAKVSAMVPWAIRVDGVKGFDAAHKAAAEASSTERFILIDGDTIPDEEFFGSVMNIPDGMKNFTFRWKSRNSVNGLIYGNGGISSWTKSYIARMQSHESADSVNSVTDFCWNDGYVSMHDCYGTTHINHSAFQAFRAGYREGVKLSLDRGIQMNLATFSKNCHPLNKTRLMQWMSVGDDVAYGLYAIVGARCGLYDSLTNTNAINTVNDSDEIYRIFDDFSEKNDRTIYLMDEASRQRMESIGIPVLTFGPKESALVKSLIDKHVNVGIDVTEIDYARHLRNGLTNGK